ncbi:MAG TPA: hypothetical protein VFQ50_11600, partial [Flavobacterium sp.]|nr:hypothetical protein [Flavobacterium sp.]
MFKKLIFWVVIGFVSGLQAQEIDTPYKNRKIVAVRDTIALDSVSINPSFFKLLDRLGEPVDTVFYKVDFATGKLVFKENAPFFNDTLTVRFLKLPEYLTKEYSIYDRSRIVSNDVISGKLYQVNRDTKKQFVPFD